jgi:hypothetical protein
MLFFGKKKKDTMAPGDIIRRKGSEYELYRLISLPDNDLLSTTMGLALMRHIVAVNPNTKEVVAEGLEKGYNRIHLFEKIDIKKLNFK